MNETKWQDTTLRDSIVKCGKCNVSLNAMTDEIGLVLYCPKCNTCYDELGNELPTD